MSMLGSFTIPATSPDVIPRRRSVGQEYIWRTIDAKWVERRSGIKPEWVVQWEASEAELVEKISSLERSKKRRDEAAGEGSSGVNSISEELELTTSEVDDLEAAATTGGRIVDIEVVAEIKRCSRCGALKEVKTDEVFICFCRIMSAREAEQRPFNGGSVDQGGGRYNLRSGVGTTDNVEGVSLSRKKTRNKLRRKKFLQKKAQAASGGQGPKIEVSEFY